MLAEEAHKKWLKTESGKAYNAKNLRYKKPALQLIQRDHIDDELYRIQEDCAEFGWLINDDDETLVSALEGDTGDLHEFRFSFSDLEAKCDSLAEALRVNMVTEHFDDFLVSVLGKSYSMVGFDSFQEDYYSLTQYERGLAEAESGKKIMRLTKQEMLSVAGQCMGIFWAFLDIRHSYDCLKSAFDVLKEDRLELMKIVESVSDRYEQLMEKERDYDFEKKYDTALSLLPDWIWIQ
jgi:hypothetical protein